MLERTSPSTGKTETAGDPQSLPFKYIVLRGEGTGPIPIIFAKNMKHVDAANSFAARGLKPTSAGFCHIDAGGKVTVGGEAESLEHLPSDPRDAGIIKAALKL